MAGAVGDVIQIGLEASVNNILMRNVFYYRVEDVPTAGYLDGLNTEFQDIILSTWAATQCTPTIFQSVALLNLFSGDVLEDNTPVPGTGSRAVSGDQSASFVAYMILLTRENNRVRHGRKYVYAPLETDVGGNLASVGFLALLTTLAGVLDDTLIAGGVDNFRPIIVGRIPYTTPGGKEAYRLPSSQAEMSDKWSYVLPCRAINRTTTMNSRKFWRGE